MDVIGGHKLRFRVNATRITGAETPKNYGSVDEFVTALHAVPAWRFVRQGGGQFRSMKSALREAVPTAWPPAHSALALKPPL